MCFGRKRFDEALPHNTELMLCTYKIADVWNSPYPFPTTAAAAARGFKRWWWWAPSLPSVYAFQAEKKLSIYAEMSVWNWRMITATTTLLLETLVAGSFYSSFENLMCTYQVYTNFIAEFLHWICFFCTLRVKLASSSLKWIGALSKSFVLSSNLHTVLTYRGRRRREWKGLIN